MICDEQPIAACNRCHRMMWASGNVDRLCSMRQADGSSCTGRFEVYTENDVEDQEAESLAADLGMTGNAKADWTSFSPAECVVIATALGAVMLTVFPEDQSTMELLQLKALNGAEIKAKR